MRVEECVGRVVRTMMCPIELFWKHPTPHEESLAKIDDFLRDHHFTGAELLTIRHCYKDARTWGLRHLRLTAAINRLRPERAPYTPEELANSTEKWHVNRPAAFRGLSPEVIAAMGRLPVNFGYVVGDGPTPINDPHGVTI